MRDYRAATYGDHIADRYDDWFPAPGYLDDTVAFLTELTGGPARILELGVGTGTFAIPLARAGHEVVGLDASPRMLERLRAKPDGHRVVPVLGDMADIGPALEVAGVTAGFDLAVAFTNTFTNLTSQAAQRACLRGAAARLGADGALVLEMAVPDERSYPGGQALRVAHVGLDHVMLQVALYDPVEQLVDGATVVLGGPGPGVSVHPVRARNVPAAELALMAELVGLLPAGRYADWSGTHYAGGRDQISVFRPAGLGAGNGSERRAEPVRVPLQQQEGL